MLISKNSSYIPLRFTKLLFYRYGNIMNEAPFIAELKPFEDDLINHIQGVEFMPQSNQSS